MSGIAERSAASTDEAEELRNARMDAKGENSEQGTKNQQLEIGRAASPLAAAAQGLSL